MCNYEIVLPHESNDDDNRIVDVGNWSACKRGGRRTVQEDDDNDNDGDEDHPINQESDDDNNNNDDGGKKERNDEESEDEGTEEVDGELNGIQQMIEAAAVAAGLTEGAGRRGRVAAATRTSPRRAVMQQNKQPKKRQRFGQVLVNEPTGEIPQRKSKRGRVPSNKAGFI